MIPLPLVTIALVVRNEERRISDCLNIHLIAQDVFHSVSRDQIEFIIVDNGSTDRTVEVVRKMLQATAVRFQICHSPENNMGLSRGLAVAQSRGEFIAFVDADCWVPREWLAGFSMSLRGATNSTHTWPPRARAMFPTQRHLWGQPSSHSRRVFWTPEFESREVGREHSVGHTSPIHLRRGLSKAIGPRSGKLSAIGLGL